ncbi:unnamed protein product [Calypogeia fissa]
MTSETTMTSVTGSESEDWTYLSIHTPSSSDSQASCSQVLKPPPILDYKGTADFEGVITGYLKRLEEDFTTDQYIVFICVSDQDLLKIDGLESLERWIRLTYDGVEDKLIVKLLPSGPHERAVLLNHYFFWSLTDEQAMELHVAGATRVISRSARGQQHAKEADASFGPRKRLTQYPTIVFEVGFSQSLASLQSDAHYWLTYTEGQVNIVILLDIDMIHRTIKIQQWRRREITGLRASLRSAIHLVPVLVMMQEIVIDSNLVVHGGSLLLDFKLIFERDPRATESAVLEINEIALRDLARSVFT